MKKLVANRHVLYGGRNFSPGEALPAHDPKMLEAWIAAGSAKWINDVPDPPEKNSAPAVKKMSTAESSAIAVIEALGVSIMTASGKFVGKKKLLSGIKTALENPEISPESTEPPPDSEAQQ